MKLIIIAYVALATTCFTAQSHSQGVVSAPLLVFTNGSGTISPFQYGQWLTVGQSYEMTAIPAYGFAFSNWQPVTVFTSITIVTNNGFAETISSINAIPGSTYTEQPVLDFIMQPVQVVVTNDLLSITVSSGWQANFMPVPEPSSAALIFGGSAAIVFCLCKRFAPANPARPARL